MKKKICLLLAIAIVLTTQSFAQQTVENEKLDYFNKAERYRKMKGTGAALTVIGSVLLAVGVVTMNNSTFLFSEDSGTWQAGALATIVGIGGVGSGIPLWAVGAHNQRKYNTKLQGLSVRVDASPVAGGVKLSYRF